MGLFCGKGVGGQAKIVNIPTLWEYRIRLLFVFQLPRHTITLYLKIVRQRGITIGKPARKKFAGRDGEAIGLRG